MSIEPKTGILLVNLGTPDSPATSDVRRYLVEFLTDPRVIDIPFLQRQLLVRGIIAPFRSPKSAKSYKEIWTSEGSPLAVISRSQADAIQASLGDAYQVELAMRYQNPSIASALEKFKGKRIKEIKVVPLFPQYASATTGSVHQEVMRVLSTWQVIPDVRFVNSYPDHPGMIAAFAELGRAAGIDSYDHILFSYHGLPERQLVKADSHGHCLRQPQCCEVRGDHNHYCYGAQCYATTHAIVKELGLESGTYTTSFQSRLGKTPWKKPYTIDTLKELVKQGNKKVLVFCPAFTSDCLETIFEIGTEYQEDFKHWGGEELTLVEGLNLNSVWLDALADLCRS